MRTERIAKVLARAGVASRREVERLIGLGHVAVNGRVLDTPATLVTRDDIVTVEGHVVGAAEATRLWRYHKPVGLMTTHKDPGGRETVFETLPEEMPRVISVGRLDINTEGLLLLTNDGALARALELPKNAVQRVYRARALGKITQAKLDKLQDGITVEGVNYGAIDARLDKAKEKDDGRANVWITLIVSEGKNREVRKVLESLGLKVNRLLRLAYGPFQLGTLAMGEVEEVGPRVIRELLEEHIAPENMPTGDRTLMGPSTSVGRRPGSALADPRKKPSRVRAEETEAATREPREPRVSKRAFGGKEETGGFGERAPRPSASKSFDDKKSKSFSKNKATRAGSPSRGPSRGGPRKFDDDRGPPRSRAGADDRPKRDFKDRDDKPRAYKPRETGDRGFGDKPARGGGFGAGEGRPSRAAKPAGRGFARDDKPARAAGGKFGDKSNSERPARSGGFGSDEARPARAPRASSERPARAGGGFGDKRAPAARGGPRKSYDRAEGDAPRGNASFGDKPARAKGFGAKSNSDRPTRAGGFGDGDAKPARGKTFSDRPARAPGAKPAGRAAAGKPGGYRTEVTRGGGKPPSKTRAKFGDKPGGKPGGFKAKPGAAPRGAAKGGPRAGPGAGPRGAKPGAKSGAKRPPAGPRGPRRG